MEPEGSSQLNYKIVHKTDIKNEFLLQSKLSQFQAHIQKESCWAAAPLPFPKSKLKKHFLDMVLSSITLQPKPVTEIG
jgi:hypothetical protein